MPLPGLPLYRDPAGRRSPAGRFRKLRTERPDNGWNDIAQAHNNVLSLPARGGPELGSVGRSPVKPLLLISSWHEKRTAIKPRAPRDRDFYVNES